MMYTALGSGHPFMIRYPRGRKHAAPESPARGRRRGAVLLSVADLRFVKPLDEALLDEVGRKFRRVVTVEDGSLRGGVGEAVAAFFNGRGYDLRVQRLGIGDDGRFLRI